MIDAVRLFPYKTYGELNLTTEHVTVTLASGREVSAKARAAVVTQPNELHLYADDDLREWKSLRLGVRVMAPEELVGGLLPSKSKFEGNAAMLIAIRCLPTKVRRRVFLTKDPDKKGEWYGELDLSVNDFSETLEVAPLLARTTRFPESAADEEGAPIATYPGAILAFGDPIRLFVDAPAHTSGGGLKVTWEDFGVSGNEWRKTHSGDLFYVDTSESPQLFLNSKHDLLKQTLMKKRPRGAEASIKAAVIAYMAHTTWSTLFLSAIADCTDEETTDVEWPTDATKAKVLKKLLPLIVPERSDDEERLRFAVELYRDSSRAGSLLTKLHSAIQGLIRVDDFLVGTLEHSTAEEE